MPNQWTGPLPLAERFWPKVEKTDGCWLWTASLNSNGYGQIMYRGQPRGAHRVAYELTIGSIPNGLTLDHLCRNPRCVNPDHLEPVTIRENVLRGTGASAQHARQTHCAKGLHELTVENSYNVTLPSGARSRRCRACHQAWRASRARMAVSA